MWIVGDHQHVGPGLQGQAVASRKRSFLLKMGRWCALLVALACMALGGCSFPDPTETEARIFRAMIQLADFPTGWRRDGGMVVDVEDAVSRSVSFRGPAGTDRYSVLASQQIIVYASSDAAGDVFPGLEDEWFPTARWTPPEQLRYESTTADRYRFECLSVTISGVPAHACGAIGQYGDMVSILLANVFEDRWFTWQDMEHVLKVVDERMDAEKR